ncbi:hypothetical protein [Sphingomonas solaris]|uniref:Uncharacterized protein n=1 Tax=Alterirhizorhabdus solaris TaxID=2529389 RepID=A0A558R5T6_9SPHN|nr:hypothetical protein [Sphingomonas solaris]TVV74744.1 hypothetical protein FOY91_08820 [Sphingomonas solaris]
MSSARFDTTFSFAKYHANCRIECACGRIVTLPPAHLQRMFPMPLTLVEARRRLVCGGCGERGRAKMIPVPMARR